jgi:hypothetical protein
MSLLDTVRSFRDSFRLLRIFVSIRRDLHSIAQTLEAYRLSSNIPSVEEQLRMRRQAEKEAAEFDRNPDLLSQPSPLTMALDDLRERHRRGEKIDEEEVLAAARAMDEEEDLKRSVW